MRTIVVALGVLAALVAGSCGTGSKPSAAPTLKVSATGMSATSCATSGLPMTVAYKTVAGVDRNLTSLDVYAPKTACKAPVVMWVHGGGYQTGDKKNQVRYKVGLFNQYGWIFVSVNYRLTRPGQTGSAKYPDHYNDVASAVAWVHAHIATYGGDGSRVALLGHSAGADIVSNVTVNPTYLARQHLGLSAIRCAGPLDTEGFDKHAADPGEKPQWKAALGNDPNYVTDTSATLLVRSGVGIPPTIGVVRGTPGRQQIETAFLARLRGGGVSTTTINARSLTHAQVNNQIGAPGDTVMTPPLVKFLTTCFAK
jgi:arylformamidase